MKAIDVSKFFNFGGEVATAEPYGNGHINDTYLITLKEGDDKFILQRLNTKIFKNYVGLMDNISKVTTILREIIAKDGGDVQRECMTLVPTVDGKLFYLDGDDCWRAYVFVDNTEVYQVISSPTIFQNTGEAFGKFIARLDGFDASALVEVIPNFHNTVDRYNKFLTSLRLDKKDRAKTAEKEIDFVKAHKDMLSAIVDALEYGDIPLRVTHNDTKINNVLIDKASGKAICVIDLDTIMPGSLLYDFGDAIRSGCNTGEEDERDLTKVDFNVELYEAFCKGFLKGIGDKITQKEIDMLHLGAIIITLECGIRFLTDYLDGDEYFKTKYPDHNLVRCRTQFKLVKLMEQMSDRLLEIARNCKK